MKNRLTSSKNLLTEYSKVFMKAVSKATKKSSR